MGRRMMQDEQDYFTQQVASLSAEVRELVEERDILQDLVTGKDEEIERLREQVKGLADQLEEIRVMATPNLPGGGEDNND
jgi:uncharacterized protein YoxC